MTPPSPPQSARERFVEAMQAVLKQNDALRGATIYDLPKCVRQAVEAFADLMSHYGPGALTPNELVEGPEFTRKHLLNECGL